MTRLIAATALTLCANLAFAFDIYGGLASPELVTTPGSAYGAGSTSSASGNMQASRDDFYQNGPDATPRYSGSANSMASATLESTPYWAFVKGDPGIDTVGGNMPGGIAESAPHQAVASVR